MCVIVFVCVLYDGFKGKLAISYDTLSDTIVWKCKGKEKNTKSSYKSFADATNVRIQFEIEMDTNDV